jgi:hypothetical protein
MAINRFTVYGPGNCDPAEPDYPFGKVRNVSVSGAGDGTPWEQTLARDWDGFFQAVLDGAAIVPSGTPDTAQASQVLTGLQTLLLQRSELASEGGTILEAGNSLPLGGRAGLRRIWDSGVLFTVNPGIARTADDSIDIEHTAALQKDISATWAEGDGVGCLPDALALAQGWYRLFLVAKPTGQSDLTLDTSASATNFFNDANAIAAGFSDNTLYRRIAWVYVDGGLVMPKYWTRDDEPTRTVWDVPVADVNQATLSQSPREVFVMTHAPPNCKCQIGIYMNLNDAGETLVTEIDQPDTTPDNTHFTLRQANNADSDSGVATYRVNAAQQIAARRTAGVGVDAFAMIILSWDDQGIEA